MSQDSERRLVTTLLFDFAQAYSKVDGVSVDMLTDPQSRGLFSAIVEMKEEGEKIDMVAVARKAELSLYDLTSYTDLSFSSVDAVEYDCNYIIKAWQGREITKTLKAYSTANDDPDKLTDDVIGKLKDIINQTAGSLDSFKDDVDNWRKHYTAEYDGDIKGGVLCGYSFIDQATKGYKPGNLIVIGARTGVGKTTFALNQAVNMANKNTNVGVISMEMTQNELIDKILGIRSGIPQDDIHGKSDQKTFAHIMGETHKIDGMPLFLSAPTTDDPNKIFNIMKQMVFKRGVGCIILDYLQLMSYPQQSQNRNYEIGKMTRKLKMLASELDVPIIVLSQLKRRDGNPAPTLNDLRDSGSIEQDANIVLFLHQPNDDDIEEVVTDLECAVAKNRGGRRGFDSLLFRKDISTILSKEGF